MATVRHRGCASLHELARSDWEELVDAGAGQSEAQSVAAFFTEGGAARAREEGGGRGGGGTQRSRGFDGGGTQHSHGGGTQHAGGAY